MALLKAALHEPRSARPNDPSDWLQWGCQIGLSLPPVTFIVLEPTWWAVRSGRHIVSS